jgi:putative copper export protein/mono/diheme cytochrome c family protein
VSPPFDLQGGVPGAAVRAVAVAGLLWVFGGLVFRVGVLPRVLPVLPHTSARRIEQLLWALNQTGVGVAGLGVAAWLVVQSWSIASAGSLAELAAALPVVAAHTAFGRLILLQAALLAASGLALGRCDHPARNACALGFASLALAVQAGHSHAWSMHQGPSWLLGFDLVHLASAGAWLGGLAPLLLVVRMAPPAAGAAACRWFSPLGKICVGAIAVSALWQGWVLVGSLPALIGTAYGWLVLIKLALFGGLLGFACANRYRFAPALLGDDPAAARAVLVRSIAVQTGVALAVVFAAGVLSNLPPSMHVQTVWPFAWRFSLVTVRGDPDYAREVLGGSLMVAGAAVLLFSAAASKHKLRWLLPPAALALAWFGLPHLSLLLIPAYPTSYYHSPTRFAASAIMDGAALYPSHCAACHGAGGHGDGPAAAGLPVPPADLTAAHLWMHSDGELFWWLAHGMAAPDGRPAMPGFAGSLTDDQRWHLIDFIRARNAGLAFAATGVWPQPLRAPELEARCAGRSMVTLDDLRGGFVRVVIGPAAVAAAPGVTTVLLAPGAADVPAPGVCIADDTAAAAFALVTGLPAGRARGAQVLIDPQGWLRAVQPGGAAGSWNDPHALRAELDRLRAAPVKADGAAAMPMDMKM